MRPKVGAILAEPMTQSCDRAAWNREQKNREWNGYEVKSYDIKFKATDVFA